MFPHLTPIFPHPSIRVRSNLRRAVDEIKENVIGREVVKDELPEDVVEIIYRGPYIQEWGRNVSTHHLKDKKRKWKR